MKELRSKCCGAKVKWSADMTNTYTEAGFHPSVWVCQKCHKPTDVEETEEED